MENLPIRKVVTDEIVKKQQENKLLVHLQSFSNVNNKGLNKEKLQPHPIIKEVKYLPISYLEMMLDEFYFGLWETTNFTWSQIGNEITGKLELKVFHPVAKVWITRTGISAIQIMVDSYPGKKPDKKDYKATQEYNKARNAWALDLQNKKPSALSNGTFSALKAFCFKNACISLGSRWGRDVNREFVDQFKPWIKDIEKTVVEYRQKVEKALDMYQDDDKQSIIDEVLENEAKGTNTVEFYESILNKLV